MISEHQEDQMGFLSKRDFEGKNFGSSLSSLETLEMVTAVADEKFKQERRLKKQRMMGTFDSKKQKSEAHQVDEAEKGAFNNTQGSYSGYLQLQVGTLHSNKEANYVVEKKCGLFIPKKLRGWQPKKEDGIREQTDTSLKQNGLKRKFQDQHDQEDKKLVPYSTRDLPEEAEEHKNEIKSFRGIKGKLMTEKKLFKSDGADNDADNYEWELDSALKNNYTKHKGLMKRQKKRFVRNSSSSSTTTTTYDLPEVFREKIESLGGIKVNLVIQKMLYKSDLVSGENRLSMPFKQIRSKFLEDDEVRWLENKGAFMTLPLIDTRRQKREICLGRWNMATSKWYVLKTQWHKEIVVTNGLKVDDLIQVWSFRDQANKLHLALVLVERNGEDSDGALCRKNGFSIGESSSGNSGGSSV